jgi:hypothetical protein
MRLVRSAARVEEVTYTGVLEAFQTRFAITLIPRSVATTA